MTGMSPLDTATLGPIRHQPDVTAAQAKVVRDALKLIATESQNSRAMTACLSLAVNGDDATLAKLGRLLK